MNLDLYKDNESDIVVAIIEKTTFIFDMLVKNNKKYVNILNNKIKIGKYNFNDESYIIVSLPYNLDISSEFIAFYKPLVTVINLDFIYDINLMSNIIESSNNIIICSNNINCQSNNQITYMNSNEDNFNKKLLIKIQNNSYENLNNLKFKYDEEIEKTILIISNILSKNIKYNNLRYLSIKILIDSNFYRYIDYYLYYNILENKYLLDYIKTLNFNDKINSIRNKKINDICKCNYE